MANYGDDLGDYLAAFTSLGSVPTSLGGYGFTPGRHGQELSALGASTSPVVDAGLPPKRLRSLTYTIKPQSAADVQRYLNVLQAKAGTSGRYDQALHNGWVTYVKVFKEPQAELEPARPDGTLIDYRMVWLGSDAFSRLGERAKRAAASAPKTAPTTAPKKTAQQAITPSPAPSTPSSATPGPVLISKGDLVTSTAAVQDVLVRLGWRDRDKTTGPLNKKLTDGSFGAMTAGNWAASARKRKLDPFIAKKSADGKQVVVRENTFLQLKAVADALVPPTQELPPLAPSPSAVTITEKRLGEVIGRLTGAPADTAFPWSNLVSAYQTAAKAMGADTSIAKDTKGDVVVNSTTWNAFVAAYDKAAPAPPPVAPSEKQNVEAAMKQLSKLATVSTPATTLKNVFNVAIENKTLKREPFTTKVWSADYVDPLLAIQKPADAIWEKAWRQLLVPGKLVAKDLKSVKLPADTSAAFKSIEAGYLAAKKAESASRKGYTQVNPAKIIDAVNRLSLSSKTFDPSGGSKELADALKTFLDLSKQSVSGDLIWVKAKDVFAKDEALAKLAAATTAAAERSKATEQYRASMTADALRASSAQITVDQLQQAIAESLAAGKATSALKTLYQAVKRNGAFDTATRDAYTEIARTATIGPAVQQFQQLLQQQLGPNFKTKFVEETRNKVWAEILSKAVLKKDGKLSIQTLPAIAVTVAEAANAYRARKQDDQIAREKTAEQKKTMAEAVKKSTVILSIFDAQQGLLQAAANKEVKGAGLKVTGRGDGATKSALFEISGMIFPPGHKESWNWDRYLNEVGLIVTSPTQVRRTWSNANYVVLPPTAANFLSERAGTWMAKNGVPAGYDDLAPVPLQNEELRLNFDKPSVITVQRTKAPTEVVFDAKAEKKKAAEKTKIAANKKKLAAEKKRLATEAKKLAEAKRKLAEEKKKLAAQQAEDAQAQEAARQAEASAKAAEQTASTLNADAIAARTAELVAQREAAQASTATGGGAQGGSSQGGGVVFDPTFNVTAGGGGEGGTPGPFTPAPPEPTPAPAPAPEPAPEPMQAGMGSGPLWLLGLAGVGLYMLRDKDKNRGTKKTADVKPGSRYSSTSRKRRTSYARTR